MSALPDDARTLLEAIAAFGRPRPTELLLDALRLGSEGQKALNTLRVARLIAISRQSDREVVECYHDRIHRSVRDGMPGEREKQYWTLIAAALHRRGRAEPEDFYDAYCGSGEIELAARYAEMAADVAMKSLAFDRAVELYTDAFDKLRGGNRDDRIRVLKGLAAALVSAGRSGDAGVRFSMLADLTERFESLGYRREAGYYFLSSGRIDEGLAAMAEALKLVGVRMPFSPSNALVSLAFNRVRLALRGIRIRTKESSAQDELQRSRTDVCLSFALGFGMVDLIRGSDFVTRAVLEALKLGDPVKLGIALGLEAGFLAAGGGASKADRAGMLVMRAQQIADETESAYLRILVCEARSMVYYQSTDRFDLALRYANMAAQSLAGKAGMAFEEATAELYAIWPLYYLGDFGELRRRVHGLVSRAEARGDQYGKTSAATGLGGVAFVAEDRGAECVTLCESILARWTSKHGMQTQHYWATFALVQALLYDGHDHAAYERIVGAWPQFKRAMMLGMDTVHAEVSHLRGRTALAAWASEREGAPRRRLLADAQRQRRVLAKKPMRWMQTLGLLLEGGIRAAQGDVPGAIDSFAQGAAQGEVLGLRVFELSARHAILRLDPEATSAGLEAIESALRDQGVTDPSKVARLFAPAPTPSR